MEEKNYDDIIELPHHTSEKRPRMSRESRAAQFSPFAALSGYEAAVRETARLTEPQSELTEDEKERINERLLMLAECAAESPRIKITHFVKDSKKFGGAYVTVTGRFVRIDEYEKTIYLVGGERIPIDGIREIECFHPIAEQG